MNQVIPIRREVLNVEAEQMALGHMLLAPESIARASVAGGSDLFCDPVHAALFGAMQRRHTAGQMVSPVAMRDAAQAIPGLAELGGASYLVRIAGASSAPAYPEYIKLLADLAHKRRIAAVISEAQAGLAGDDPADIVAGRLEAGLLSAAPADTGRGPVSMHKAVNVAMEQISAAYRGEALDVVRSGINALDRMTGGFYPGELILIGGRPSMGKTAVALSVALNAARAGNGVCIASLEMNPEAMAMRALSEATTQTRSATSYAGLRRGDMTEAQVDALRACAAEVANLPITFLPRQFADIGALFSGAKQAHKATRGGLKLLIVDYAQLLRSRAPTRYEQITEISIALKALSGQLNIPVIALSQLSRQVESREDKRPVMSDLRESGQLEQDADAVLFCYRDEYYVERMKPGEDAEPGDMADWIAAMNACRNKLEIIVAKQRQGEIGTAHVRFNPALNLIWE